MGAENDEAIGTKRAKSVVTVYLQYGYLLIVYILLSCANLG